MLLNILGTQKSQIMVEFKILGNFTLEVHLNLILTENYKPDLSSLAPYSARFSQVICSRTHLMLLKKVSAQGILDHPANIDWLSALLSLSLTYPQIALLLCL